MNSLFAPFSTLSATLLPAPFRRAGMLLLALLLLSGLAACGARAAPASSEMDVLYRDSFAPGETGPWMVEGDAQGRTAVLDERLIIQIDTPTTMQFATLPEPIFSDFVLQVEARLLAGSLQSSYGILFRMQDATRFYRFEITPDGFYMVERRNADGSWTRFVPDWSVAPAIRQGIGVVNQLRVEAVGSDMRFYVNDTLVQQVTDSQYATGTIALDAGTFGEAGLQVAFDNLLVKRP